jgi:hypothetical protein
MVLDGLYSLLNLNKDNKLRHLKLQTNGIQQKKKGKVNLVNDDFSMYLHNI